MSYNTETWHNYGIKLYLYPVNYTVIFARIIIFYSKSATLDHILIYFNINRIISIIFLVALHLLILDNKKTANVSKKIANVM